MHKITKQGRLSTALLFVFATAFIPGVASATSTGEVDITGNILANSCDVSVDDRDKRVDMGSEAAKQFKYGSGATRMVPFTITLVDCGPAVTGLRIIFQGPADQNRPDLLALDAGAGAATGIGIALFDGNKVQIPVNTQSEPYSVEPGTDSIPLQYYAQYTANGASIVAGQADSFAVFDFEYD